MKKSTGIRCVLGAIGLAATTACAGISPWAGTPDGEALIADLKAFFEGAETRFPGSPGNLRLEQQVMDRFAASGLPHGAIEFNAPSFLPGRTELTLGAEAAVELHPMHPTLFRPGNFKEEDFSAPLVYLGRARPEDLAGLQGQPLQGALAVLEFDCAEDWLHVLRFGVRGFLFLPPGVGEPDRYDALTKVFATEVSVPRFWIEPEDAERIRAAAREHAHARIMAEPSRWAVRALRTPWVMIPGADPELGREGVVLAAPLDANSIVPGLAHGAQNGANLFVLMRLFERLREQPPARSVLLVAVNARTLNGLGERLLAWYLLADRAAVESVRDRLSLDVQEQQLMAGYYARLRLDEFRPEDEEILVDLRTRTDRRAARILTIKDPIVARARGDVNRIKNERLLLNQRQAAESSRRPDREYQAALARLDEQQTRFVRILTLFNRVGVRTVLSDLDPEGVGILRGYVRDILSFFRTSAALNQADLDRDLRNGAIRQALEGRRVSGVVLLEMDWATDRVGFSTDHTGEALIGQAVIRWGLNTARIAEALPGVADGKHPSLLIDTLSRRGGLSESYFFPRHPAEGTSDTPVRYFPMAGNTPAFALRNVFSDYGRAFLPTDTLERLDPGRTADLFVFCETFLPALIDDPQVLSSAELGPALNRQRPMWTRRFGTFKFDELAASVHPDIPISGTAVIVRSPGITRLDQRMPAAHESIVAGDILFADLLLTDARAVVYNYALIPTGAADVFNAFQYDPDFRHVEHVLDVGDAFRKIGPQDRFMDALLPMFEGVEYPLWNTNDPSLTGATFINIASLIPMTARGNATPRKFGITGVGSPMTPLSLRRGTGAPAALFLPAEEPIKIATDQKRLLLNATSDRPEGLGFEAPGDMDPDLVAQAAEDMAVLNRARIAELADVATDLAREFMERGDAALERMREAHSRGDYPAYLNHAHEALGAQTKSYDQTKQTTDDMLKAVVVYMALLLPFCFFIMKLVFTFTRIEHEMGMFAVLFVLTFLVFRVIHPAFRVAQAAEAIFIAFIMGALGLFVISILRGRFEGEMQVLFRTFTGMDTDTVGYSLVTQKAMLVGVNNMKRRRVRTVLTTATIVLVAFTMLSFTSVTKRVRPTIIAISRDAPYTGFLYHWPDLAPMDEASAGVARSLFAGHGTIAERRWLVADPASPFRMSRGPAHVHVDAVLGLSTRDRDFLGPFPLTAGAFFSHDFAPEALVSASAAALLHIEEDDVGRATVDHRGRTFRVVGFFDDVRFRDLRDLNGIPLAPVLRMLTEGGGDAGADATDPSGLSDPGALLQADTGALLILPVETARRLGAQPFSLSLRLDSEDQIWSLADQLLTATAMRFYLSGTEPIPTRDDRGEPGGSLGAGVYFVGSNYRTSVGGLAVLIIPLIIAATIILNTMLGAVYERKQEIAIYNAIGLNPHHIGLFFLAESFVYGVIGSVGGYLIGQVLSIVLSRTGWIQGINLNYSSLSVAYVILFTIAMVLLSTLYPAVTATRAAVPSGKHKWSLPRHDGRTMCVLFPFIYQPHIAVGVLGYVREYLDRFTEASIGDLIATRTECRADRDEKDRPRYTVAYRLALAPYDLGVTQDGVFRLFYDDAVQAYRLELNNVRISGQDSNWVTTNRPFLERLRKHLMRWRNLTPARQEAYREAGARLFTGAES